MSKHTPGPWQFDPFIGDVRAGMQSVAATLPQNRAANGPLIAAAPEMYEALEGLCNFAWSAVDADCQESREYLGALIGIAKVALAKAVSK